MGGNQSRNDVTASVVQRVAPDVSALDATVAKLKSKYPNIRQSALRQILDAGKRQGPASAWALPYLSAGVVEVMVDLTAATPLDGLHTQIQATKAALRLLLTNEIGREDASRRLLLAYVAQCQSGDSCSPALNELLSSVLDLAIIFKAAEEINARVLLTSLLIQSLKRRQLGAELLPHPGPPADCLIWDNHSPLSRSPHANVATQQLTQSSSDNTASRPTCSSSTLQQHDSSADVGKACWQVVLQQPCYPDMTGKVLTGPSCNTRHGVYQSRAGQDATNDEQVNIETAPRRLAQLGTSIGESLVAADLAALVSYHGIMDMPASSKASNVPLLERQSVASYHLADDASSGSLNSRSSEGDFADVSSLDVPLDRRNPANFRGLRRHSYKAPHADCASLQAVSKAQPLNAAQQHYGTALPMQSPYSAAISGARGAGTAIVDVPKQAQVNLAAVQVGMAHLLCTLIRMSIAVDEICRNSPELIRIIAVALMDMAIQGTTRSELWKALIQLLHWEDATYRRVHDGPCSIAVVYPPCGGSTEDPVAPAGSDPAAAALAGMLAATLGPMMSVPVFSRESVPAAAGLLQLLTDFVAVSPPNPSCVRTVLLGCGHCLLPLQVALQGINSRQPGWLNFASSLLSCLAALATAARTDGQNRLLLLGLLFPDVSALTIDSPPPLTAIAIALWKLAAANFAESDILHSRLDDDRDPTLTATEALFDLAQSLSLLAADSNQQATAADRQYCNRIYVFLNGLLETPDGMLLRVALSEAGTCDWGCALSAVQCKALASLATILEDKENPFVSSHHASQYVYLHFMRFLKEYNSRTTAEIDRTMQLACGHLQVLIALAKKGHHAVRHRFLQLRVMQYLVCQLDAELRVDMAPSSSTMRADVSPPSTASLVLQQSAGEALIQQAHSETGGSTSRSIPRLNLGSRASAPPAAIAVKSSRSSRSITWADNEDGQPGSQDDTPRTAADDSICSHSNADTPSAIPCGRPPAVPSLNLVENWGPSAGGTRGMRTSARGPPSGGARNSSRLSTPVAASRLGANPSLSAAASPASPLQRGSRVLSSPSLKSHNVRHTEQPRRRSVEGVAFATGPASGGQLWTESRISAPSSLDRAASREALHHVDVSVEGSLPHTSLCADQMGVTSATAAPARPLSQAMLQADVLHASECSNDLLEAHDAASATSQASSRSIVSGFGPAGSLAVANDGSLTCSSHAETNREVSAEYSPQPPTLPAGFQFTGDLDKDVEALEALKSDWSDEGSESETDSYRPSCSPIVGIVPLLDTLKIKSKASHQAILAQPGSRPGSEPVTLRSGGQCSSRGGGRATSMRLLTNLEAAAAAKGKMQAVSRSVDSWASEVGAEWRPPSARLDAERAKRRLYSDLPLHLAFLRLALALLLHPDGSLDDAYTGSDSSTRAPQNVPFVLLHHLNHPRNAAVVAPLLEWSRGLPSGGPRLMRLLCRCLFNGSLYTCRRRLAHGAYAQVMSAEAPAVGGAASGVALKISDLPASVHDGRALADVFSEVSLLHAFRSYSAVCQMWDFGVEGNSFVVVLRQYDTSLARWRAEQPDDPVPLLPLYLAIFVDILRAVQVLHANNTVHFDLKCDNVLLEALPGLPPSTWPQHVAALRLPFRVALADFGESRAFGPLSPRSSVTTRNRGTECVKSPEMLLVANAARKSRDNVRQHHEGAGAPSDVWSLGCLLYELLTGKFLLHDTDWIRFFMRVTRPGAPVIPPVPAAILSRLDRRVTDIMEAMLTRDVHLRPSVPEILLRVKRLQKDLISDRPPEPSPSPPLIPSGSSAFSNKANVGTTPRLGEASGSDSWRSSRDGRAMSPAQLRLPYVTCEYYLTTISAFPEERLWLASLQGLQNPAELAAMRISHVVILCHPPGGHPSLLPTTKQKAYAARPAGKHFATGVAAERSKMEEPSQREGPEQQLRRLRLMSLLAECSVRDAVHSCGAAMAHCTLAPISICQEVEEASLESEPRSPQAEVDQSQHAATAEFADQLPMLLRLLAALPAEAHVCVAAAAGLDGEASVLTAARLAQLRGISALEALISVSHTRLALHLQERHISALEAWAQLEYNHPQQQQQQQQQQQLPSSLNVDSTGMTNQLNIRHQVDLIQ